MGNSSVETVAGRFESDMDHGHMRLCTLPSVGVSQSDGEIVSYFLSQMLTGAD